MRQRAPRQRQLFEESKPLYIPPMALETQQEATRLLTQWMQAIAEAISKKEPSDGQDYC